MPSRAGLFASVMPAVKPPGPNAAPAFLLKGSSLQTVAPAGEIEFIVKERVLPKLASLEIIDQAGAEEAPAGDLTLPTCFLRASCASMLLTAICRTDDTSQLSGVGFC